MDALHLTQTADITVICETKLNSLVQDASLEISGYQMYRADRNSCGGGVIVYTNENLKVTQLMSTQQDYNRLGIETIILSINLRYLTDLAIFICAYRPPNSGKNWFELFEQLVTYLMPMGKLFIMGDLNADLLKPCDYRVKNKLFGLRSSTARRMLHQIKSV